jgi:putative ABC transport system ATP-binding protein
VGFIFQSFNLVPYLTAFENVSIGESLAKAGENDLVLELLGELSLLDRKDHLPSELSVGQQQRVALARALVKNPKLILADEPTGNLDPATGKDVMDIIKKQHLSGRTVVLITHDPSMAQRADRMLKIVEGRVVEQGT